MKPTAGESQRRLTSSAPSAKCWRITFLSNLPTEVRGTASMKAQASGSCHLATFVGEEARAARRASPTRPRAARRRRAGARPTSRRGSPTTAASSDVGVGHQRVLQVDRGDPLAAGLDDVLGAVGQREEAVPVEGADVTGAQPAVAELLRVGVVVLVVAGGDPRAAHLELADRLAVARAAPGRRRRRCGASTPASSRPWLRGSAQSSSLSRRPRPGAARRRDRRGLGHAPRLEILTPCRSRSACISAGGHRGPAARAPAACDDRSASGARRGS